MEKSLAQKASRILKVLAHPTRLRIVDLLRKNELCVGDLAEILHEREPAISQQLNKMKDKGILNSRRDGNKVFYYLKDTKMINRLLSCMVKGSNDDILR